MIPAPIDFLLRTNADYGEELQFADGTIPVSLEGLTFAMEVRRYPGGPLLFAVPISISDAEDGVVSIAIPRANITAAFQAITGRLNGEPVQASHDIIVTHVDGYREPWSEGRVTIYAGVTHNG